METDSRPTFRTPIVLLALANFVILAVRLWPWQNVVDLPGNGTTGIDPAITLVAYAGLGFWIGAVRTDASRKSLFSAAVLGIVAGGFLVGQVAVAATQSAEASPGSVNVQIVLFVCAALTLGIVGWRAARAGNTLAFSVICALWAAMLSSLMAVTAILCQAFFHVPPAMSSDPWQQYEGLAIGTPAIQALVHSLDAVSGFLLLGPIVGCVAGALFASVASPQKP